MDAAHQPMLDPALEQIEQSVLPGISVLLDTLLDAAAAARPGIDARRHATELRSLAFDVVDLTRQIAAVSAPALPAQQPARLRISA